METELRDSRLDTERVAREFEETVQTVSPILESTKKSLEIVSGMLKDADNFHECVQVHLKQRHIDMLEVIRHDFLC